MKISITLPTYNHAKYLSQNIESVLAQTYADWELLIVDDGSTDDSWSIIDRFRAADSRIHPVRLPQNTGANSALQRCLSMARGDLLYASSTDDFLESASFFVRTVEELRRHPAAGGVCGRSRVVDAGSQRELWIMGTPGGRYGFISAPGVLKRFCSGKLFIPGIAAIWRRARIDEVGGYDPTLGPQSDYFVNHAVPALNGVVFIEDVVSVTRVARSGYSSSVSDEEFFRHHALFERRMRSLPYRYPIRDEWFRVWRSSILNGRFDISRQRQLFEFAQRAFGRIENWELNVLPSKFLECREFVLDACRQLEAELSMRQERATEIFDELAGKLLPDSAATLSWHSSLLAGLKSLGARMARKLRAMICA